MVPTRVFDLCNIVEETFCNLSWLFHRAGRLAMIRGVTAVSPITVAIFAGPNRLPIEAVAEADAGVQGEFGAMLLLRFYLKIYVTCFKLLFQVVRSGN